MKHTNHTLNKQFVAFMNAEIRNLSQQKHFGQAQKVRSTRNSFNTFLTARGWQHICVGGITRRVVGEYQQWLIGRGVRRNSSSCYMRTLQGLYNRAVAGIPVVAERPFSEVYRGIAKTKKRATSIGVMQKMQCFDIREGLIALGKNPKRKTFNALCRKIEFARDLFIFSYCARGMSFVDVAYLRKQNLKDGIVSYVRRKTGQHIEVALEPLMQEIIRHYDDENKQSPYIFPILHSTDEETAYNTYRTALRTYNGYLKILSQMLGGNVSLTSYVARHSWASNMHEMNVPLSIISQGLGHDSELTTQIYIKSLEINKVHKANKNFINQVFTSHFF